MYQYGNLLLQIMIQETNSLCGKILGVIIFQICVSVKWVDTEFVLIFAPQWTLAQLLNMKLVKYKHTPYSKIIHFSKLVSVQLLQINPVKSLPPMVAVHMHANCYHVLALSK